MSNNEQKIEKENKSIEVTNDVNCKVKDFHLNASAVDKDGLVEVIHKFFYFPVSQYLAGERAYKLLPVEEGKKRGLVLNIRKNRSCGLWEIKGGRYRFGFDVQ